jgi:DNA-binding NtrC family response regulator
MDRAVVIAQGEVIALEDLPERVRGLAAAPATPARSTESTGEDQGAPDHPDHPELGEINLQQELQRYETELILRALERADWNRKRAAEKLGLPLRTLGRRMQAFGIKRVGYKKDDAE